MTTLKILRERCAAAYAEAKKVTNGLNMKPRYRDLNMRQAWLENAAMLAPFLRAEEDFPGTSSISDPRLLKFHYEGEVYYHAKKHGLQSAMMLKLSRP